MKKILTFQLLLWAFFAFNSCDWMKETTKEVINKSGETVGKATTEFAEGVTEGIDRSLDCELKLSEKLIGKGLQTGKFSIKNDSLGHTNNVLSLYIIFNKGFEGELQAKVFDKKGLECGRKTMPVQAKANESRYIDFIFDSRTEIEVRSKITIE